MLSLRKCKQCGDSFDALVGKDKNVYCEKCREFVRSVNGDADYFALAKIADQNRKPPATTTPLVNISSDELNAILKIPIVTKPPIRSRNPSVLNDFGEFLK